MIAPTPLAHPGADGGAAEQERAAKVGVEVTEPFIVGDPGQTCPAGRPGVVDEDVQVPEARGGAGDHLVDLIAFAHIDRLALMDTGRETVP